MEQQFEGYFVRRHAKQGVEQLVPTEALEPEEVLFSVVTQFYLVLSQPSMEILEVYSLVPL